MEGEQCAGGTSPNFTEGWLARLTRRSRWRHSFVKSELGPPARSLWRPEIGQPGIGYRGKGVRSPALHPPDLRVANADPRPIALITGASAGIGAACAERFARDGHRVVVSARSEARLRELAERLNREHGEGTALAVAFDVADAAAVASAVAGLPAEWAEVDVLVANAGLALNLVPVWENTPEEIDRMVDTNVKGVVNCLRALVPGMLQRGRGHIVTVGSTAGHGVYPGGVVYCATKHALLALTLGLKLDLHGTPVRATAVSPGLTETEFSLVRFEGDAERAGEAYADTRPLTADDVADAIAYVVAAPAHVNVQELLVTPRVQSGLTMIARGADAERL